MEPEIDLSSIVEKLDDSRRWNSFRPKLTHAQWEICESYGGWTRFVEHYGLVRPWEKEQSEEGVKILEIIARRIEDANAESPNRAGS